MLPALSSAPPCVETILAPFVDKISKVRVPISGRGSNPDPKFIPTPGEGEEPGLRVARTAPVWFAQHCSLSLDLTWTKPRVPK